VIHPVLIDREMPRLQARLDELNKIAEAGKADGSGAGPGAGPGAQGLTAEDKKEFIAVTTQLKLLDDRRQQILARTGDEYLVDPPKVQAKP
jgi:hypothetical protein